MGFLVRLSKLNCLTHGLESSSAGALSWKEGSISRQDDCLTAKQKSMLQQYGKGKSRTLLVCKAVANVVLCGHAVSSCLT